MERFTGKVEFLSAKSAIVALFDSRGEWSGAGRVEIKRADRDALYAACFADAEQRAACKGGVLDRFTVAS